MKTTVAANTGSGHADAKTFPATGHAEEPWTADLSGHNGHCGFSIMSSDGSRVATVYCDLNTSWPRGSDAQQPQNAKYVANAHLIEAAPKLLSALRAILTKAYLEKQNPNDDSFNINTLRADAETAIDKAEGRQQ